jgi:hypothetical protein
MKIGTITSYNAEKGAGLIYVNSIVGEQYFFYRDRVISGEPVIGAQVIFKVSWKPVRPGQLPYAAQIIVQPSSDAVSQIFNAAKRVTQ